HSEENPREPGRRTQPGRAPDSRITRLEDEFKNSTPTSARRIEEARSLLQALRAEPTTAAERARVDGLLQLLTELETQLRVVQDRENEQHLEAVAREMKAGCPAEQTQGLRARADNVPHPVALLNNAALKQLQKDICDELDRRLAK